MGAGRGSLGLHELLVLLHSPWRAVELAVFLPPVDDAAAAVGLGGLQDLHSGAGARGRQARQGSSPALDASGLLVRGEEHVCRVPHVRDRGQGLLVRVVHHHGTGSRVPEPAQRRRISGQRKGPGRARLAGPDGIPRLPLEAAHQEVRRGGRGLNQGSPGPRDESSGQKADPDHCGGGCADDAREQQGRDEHCGSGGHAGDPRGGEAKQQS